MDHPLAKAREIALRHANPTRFSQLKNDALVEELVKLSNYTQLTTTSADLLAEAIKRLSRASDHGITDDGTQAAILRDTSSPSVVLDFAALGDEFSYKNAGKYYLEKAHEMMVQGIERSVAPWEKLLKDTRLDVGYLAYSVINAVPVQELSEMFTSKAVVEFLVGHTGVATPPCLIINWSYHLNRAKVVFPGINAAAPKPVHPVGN